VPTTCGSRLPIDAFFLENTLLPILPPALALSRTGAIRTIDPLRSACRGRAVEAQDVLRFPLPGSGVRVLVPHQPRCASSPSSSSAHEVEWAEVTHKLRVIVPISVKILLLQYTPKKFMRTAGTSSESNRSIVFLGPAPKRPAAQSYPKCACFVARPLGGVRRNRCARLWPLLPGCHFASAPIP
jgi:hypothetical protein